MRRNNGNGGDSSSSKNDDAEVDWYIASRAILPFFDADADDGLSPPTKRRRLHLNDLPDEVLIKVGPAQGFLMTFKPAAINKSYNLGVQTFRRIDTNSYLCCHRPIFYLHCDVIRPLLVQTWLVYSFESVLSLSPNFDVTLS